jgi:multiple sugar transport system ATP-binding protein
MGSEVYLHLKTGKSTLVAKVGGHDLPEVNQDIDIVLDMSKVHFFNKDTENAIV